nr:isochorismatase family protein [Bacteroidota bacterium]
NPGYDLAEKTINSFEIDDIFLNGIIDQQNLTVTLKAPAKVNISNLTPKIKISEGASIQPGSLVPVDFSSDVTYTVTAENGTTQNYTVSAILLTDTAFVIIDMQNGAFENPDFPILNKAEITTNIKQLAERVRDAGKHVVYSQATSANLIEGSYEWQPVPGLGFHDGDVVVLKTSSNAFQGSDLHKELAEINIGSIIICGVATDMCINNSFGGALDRRYDIIMMADGHSTMGDTYEVIIEQYNQTWQSKGAGVKNGDEIVF